MTDLIGPFPSTTLPERPGVYLVQVHNLGYQKYSRYENGVWHFTSRRVSGAGDADIPSPLLRGNPFDWYGVPAP